MKKVFSSHAEVCHIWAQQNQSEGKANNVFFDGTTIYSYGRHFAIANFVKPNVVLFNSENYSVSTSKHKSHVLRAIPDNVRTFCVPEVTPVTEYYHLKNVEYYVLQIRNAVYDATKSKKYSENCIGSALHFRNELLAYVSEFELNYQLPSELIGDLANDEIKAKIERQKEVARIAEEKFEREQRERELKERTENLPKWLNGERPYLSLPECYLRLKDETVETSKGAKVSVRAAKVLYEMIKAGKEVKGHQIDNYTVISINGVLKVGCHTIERSEIERFAISMNW